MVTNKLLVFYCIALLLTDLYCNKSTNNYLKQSYRPAKRVSIPPLGYIAELGRTTFLFCEIKKTALLPFEKV